MKSPRAQSVADADRDIRQYLIRIAGTLGEVLGDRLAGLYVRGSLATGSFHRDRSSIDLICVVARKLEPAERARVAREIVKLDDARPVVQNLRLAIVRERDARTFEHPMPSELLYGPSVHEAFRHGKFDFEREDRVYRPLAAQIFETRERGVTLVGPAPGSLFGPVPWHAYIDSLESDFEHTRALIESNPFYAVLRLCVILHGTATSAMTAPSMDEAAVWALQTVPRMYHSVINDALQIYRETKSLDDVVFHERDVIAFREYVRHQAKGAFERASDSGEDDE